MGKYKVVVGNVVYDGDSSSDATMTFFAYADQSHDRMGRASGEPVTIFENGEPINEYPSATLYGRVIEYIVALGDKDGRDAAAWYIQDSIGVRATGDVRPTARRILKGIDDGDPMVLQTFPSPYPRNLTGPTLVGLAIVNANDRSIPDVEWNAYWREHDIASDICDAYEIAFSQAVEDEITLAARLVLEDE